MALGKKKVQVLEAAVRVGGKGLGGGSPTKDTPPQNGPNGSWAPPSPGVSSPSGVAALFPVKIQKPARPEALQSLS